MIPTSNKTLIDQLQWRYATKKFDPAKTIAAADWATLEQSLILSASSFGLQPYKFIIVTDPAIKAQLPAMSWNQTQPRDCSHLVVFAGKLTFTTADVDHFLALTAQIRGGSVESLAGYREMIIGNLVTGPRSQIIAEWAAYQAYLALGGLLTGAAILGIDACPLEGIIPEKYDSLFGLPALQLGTLCACALGYRADDDKYATLPKVRLPASELIIRI